MPEWHRIRMSTTCATEALATRFQETKARYEDITAQIAQRGIRRREFGRFIRSVEGMPEVITEFSEELWAAWSIM